MHTNACLHKNVEKRNHETNVKTNENETVVIVDASTMLQRFFFSCFTITNDHKDYVKASLIKDIACMFM